MLSEKTAFSLSKLADFFKSAASTNQNVENCSTIVISEASEAVNAPP